VQARWRIVISEHGDKGFVPHFNGVLGGWPVVSNEIEDAALSQFLEGKVRREEKVYPVG
jgi:hypothetical protein